MLICKREKRKKENLQREWAVKRGTPNRGTRGQLNKNRIFIIHLMLLLLLLRRLR